MEKLSYDSCLVEMLAFSLGLMLGLSLRTGKSKSVLSNSLNVKK